MSGKSTELTQFLQLCFGLGCRSSALTCSGYCRSQTLFPVCRSEKVSNKSKWQPDQLSWLGKGNSACRGVLLGLGGAVWLLTDGLVVDAVILHYPS